MAITQTSPPVITGVCKVGEELTATPGVYESGEIKNTKWYYSENGGADWTVKGLTKSHLLTAEDVGRVFKVADVVQEGEEDPEEFDSAKTGVVYPADTTIGTVSIGGPATGLVGEAISFSANNTGDSEYLTYAWEVEGEGVNCDIADSASNPVNITFSEPAAAAKIKVTVSTVDTTCTDNPQTAEKVYDSQVLPPEPEPGAELEKKTDTVLDGVPFVGEILTIIPGTAQGGKEPYVTTYSWQRGDQGTWHTIDGFKTEAYSPNKDDIGFSIRGVATITDSEDAELVLPSLGTTPVVEQPEVIDPDSGFSGWVQYNIANLLYHYRQWHKRDLVIGAIDHQTFTVTGAGRMEDLGRAASTPTDGEIVMVWNWLVFHWTGTIENVGEGAAGVFKLSCVGSGRFVPSGGVAATIIGLPPFAQAPEEEVEA